MLVLGCPIKKSLGPLTVHRFCLNLPDFLASFFLGEMCQDTNTLSCNNFKRNVLVAENCRVPGEPSTPTDKGWKGFYVIVGRGRAP